MGSRRIVERRGDVRYRQLERINRMPIFLVQWPPDILIERLHRRPRLLGNMSHDARNHLALIKPLLTLHDILGRHAPFREINIALFFVNAEDDDDFIAADTDEFLDGSDAPPGELREEDHAVDVVVFEEFDVGAHFGNLRGWVVSGGWFCGGGGGWVRTCLTLTMTNSSRSGYLFS